jgi:hypothetical protein
MLKIISNKEANKSEPYKNYIFRFNQDDIEVIRYADLFYFCTDNYYVKGENYLTKGILNFLLLLHNWKKHLLATPISQSVYLPFDFSDEYLGGLYIVVLDDENIEFGYAISKTLEGGANSPTQLEMMNLQREELIFIFEHQQMKKSEFLEFVDDSIYEILSSLKEPLPLA